MGDHLTHLDARGAARMVDVAGKDVTVRTATATGLLRTTPEVVELLRGAGVPKGDALAVARIAGIMGAKRTPDLVPLCHPIALHGVSVDLEVTDDGVRIAAHTRTADRTGVEMEALTAVAAAGLALIDMVKAVDRGAVLTDVALQAKSGGRSGTWTRDATTEAPGGGPARDRDIVGQDAVGKNAVGQGAAAENSGGRHSRSAAGRATRREDGQP